MKRFTLVACIALASCCDKGAIGDNITKLSSAKTRIRSQAAQDLARCGNSARNAVGPLGSLLYDENVGVQSAAAYALRKIDTKEARELLQRVEAQRRADRK